MHAFKHTVTIAYERATHNDTSAVDASMENFTTICQTLINQAQEVVVLLHNYQLGVGDVDKIVSKIISMMKLRVRPDDCSKHEQMTINLVEGKFTV